MLCMLLAIYYLPIWYEATRGTSATKAGIEILPLMIGITLAAGISGGLVSYFGRYYWFITAGPLLLSVASGLMYGATPFDASSARLIGWQILLSIGIGVA